MRMRDDQGGIGRGRKGRRGEERKMREKSSNITGLSWLREKILLLA